MQLKPPTYQVVLLLQIIQISIIGHKKNVKGIFNTSFLNQWKHEYYLIKQNLVLSKSYYNKIRLCFAKGLEILPL